MKAETATDKLAAAARGNGAAMMTMNTAVRQQSVVLGAARSGMGLTATEGLNLSRQMTDVGVTMAMGMNPFMIAIQQGPQVMDVFQQAAMRTGVTVKAAMIATGQAAWAALAPILAIVAPLIVAAGALAAGWGLASRAITKEIGDVGKEMNLTEDQLERLKDKNIATTATAGDAWNALGTTIKDMFGSVFGEQLSWVDKQWNAFLDDLTANTGKEVDAIAGFFTGAYNVVRDTWKMLPRALGDAAVSAANAAVDAMNWLIRKSGDGIQSLRDKYNALPEWMRNGQRAPDVGSPFQIGRLDNPYAGGMNAVADTGSTSYGAGYASRQGMAGRFMNTWRENTNDSAEARIRAGAGDAGSDSDSAGRTARAAREARVELEQIERIDMKPLRGMFIEIVEPLQLVADEMRLIDGLAQDMAAGLTSAFGQSGAALGDLLTTMSGYQAKLADIDLAEREYRLTAIQAERERASAQVQNYGDMIGAARGFFEEGSEGYKVLLAAEQAWRIYQLVSSVQAMVMGGQETAFTVAQNAVRATSHGVVAVARAIASLPFPLNIAAGAATIAALAAIGVKLMGGSGGGGGGAGGAEREATNSIRSTADMGQARVVGANGTTTIRVVPNDDRFSAYVDSRVQPAAATAYRASVTSSRGIVPADQTRRDRFKLGGKSAYGR
jgi:hypothetical protein